ncbi:32 kDa beta-galactoside-binding lectin-like isoform X2 [Chironomus tepperi]|uniref:32 kDa beta-galactoside-binding lectin-like isoform X2 n=1 Tax=Chironomus tepperi TaxID=113505 RepID=UPI00391FBE67
MLTSFLGNLYGPVDVGQIFVIAGKTVDGASILEVDLAATKYDPTDVPLHISVQFHSETIERNSLIDGAWGEGETVENAIASTNPIVPGWDFRLCIFTGDEKFHIAINDQPFCTYNHRLPLELINAISITGDVQKIFQVDHRRAYPSPWPLLQEEITRNSGHSFDTPKKFYVGHVFVISAIPSGNPNGTFVLKLHHGSSVRQMFHLSARFNQRNVIVNSQSDSLEWRKDEEKYGFPFQLDQMFKLGVAITENAFVVAVDGNIFFTYHYRFGTQFLDVLAGIKLSPFNGLQLEVQGVDHFNTGTTNCEGFEAYTHPDALLD